MDSEHIKVVGKKGQSSVQGQLSIYDSFGRTLYQNQSYKGEAINVRHLPTGRYYIKVLDKGYTEVLTFNKGERLTGAM